MAAPIDLNDFDSVSLRRLAKRTRDATQSRRLLALAEVYDGGQDGCVASAASVCRSFATGCCASTPADRTGWSMGSHRAHPRSSTPITAAHWRRLLRPALPAVDGVVRWRRKDLARWLLETFAISLDETTVGRELKALGFAISARPRHYAQNELAVFPAELAKIRARLPVEIELWWQDEAPGRRISSHARLARARGRPATSAPNGPISCCPAKGKGAGLSCPGATPTPWRRTSSRSVPPSIPAPMRC